MFDTITLKPQYPETRAAADPTLSLTPDHSARLPGMTGGQWGEEVQGRGKKVVEGIKFGKLDAGIVGLSLQVCFLP